MRLDDEPLSQMLLDLSGFPKPKKKRRYPDGKKSREYDRGTVDSYVNNSYGDMTPDEISMVRSGASYKDIMFLRALKAQDNRGFSPYFNPNRR